MVRWYLYTDLYWEFLDWCRDLAVVDRIWWYNPLRHTITETHTGENMFARCLIMRRIPNKVYCMPSDKGIMIWNIIGIPILVTRLDTIFYPMITLPMAGVGWCRYNDSRLHVNSLRPRQMNAISQTTFSNAFSWIKMFEFRLKFHWSLFSMVQLTIFQQWFI